MTDHPEWAREKEAADRAIDSARFCLRGSRGCMTDDQYREALGRIQLLVERVRAETLTYASEVIGGFEFKPEPGNPPHKIWLQGLTTGLHSAEMAVRELADKT